MSLQRMDTLMLQARAEKIAIGAFECWESLNIQAIAKAAARRRAVRTSGRTYCGCTQRCRRQNY